MKQTIILNQNRDFQTLYKRGISFVTPFVVIYMRPNRFGVHRLGITAGKRVGNAAKSCKTAHSTGVSGIGSRAAALSGYRHCCPGTDLQPDIDQIGQVSAERNHSANPAALGTAHSDAGRRKILQAGGNTAMKTLLLLLIRFYRRVLSPLKKPCCRYYPTCSAYALQAVKRFGAWHGTGLAVRRILRCNPWSPGGFDAVPLTLPQKRHRWTKIKLK